MGAFESFYEIVCFDTGSGGLIALRSKKPVFLDSTLSQMLYLDTARLGLVSPSAKRALIAAMEFNQVFGAGAYFDELLMSGTGGVAGANEFDGLEIWPGIEAFSTDIKETFFGSNQGDLVFASKTSSLMSLAAEMLFSRCSRVLVTDLNWQPYDAVLQTVANKKNGQISKVEIKQQIFDRSLSADAVIEKIASTFIDERCDGIFLPAVCDWGIALPVTKILECIRSSREIRFALLDTAQAINHVDLHWGREEVDFSFGGTHKWLRSYEPMAIGHFAKPSSRTFIRDVIDRHLADNPLADPLLRITQANAPQKSETVNLCPLFAAAGALEDAKTTQLEKNSDHSRSAMVDAVNATSWEMVSPNTDFDSQILMFKNSKIENADPRQIRNTLNRLGVAASAYAGGVCRVSVPQSITQLQADQMEIAFREAG